MAVGIKSETPAVPDAYNQGEMGEITYAVTGGSARSGATVEADGKVSSTMKGEVIVTATTNDAGTKYAGGEVGTYTVIFTGQPAVDLGAFGNPASVAVGIKSETPAVPDAYNQGEMGEITYAVTGGSAMSGATVEADGKVSSIMKGEVIVTATTNDAVLSMLVVRLVHTL